MRKLKLKIVLMSLIASCNAVPTVGIANVKTLRCNFSPFETVNGDDYCTGWSDGFCAGYKYNNLYAICPPPPICPIAFIGRDSYADGYQRGMLAGMQAAR